MRKKQIIRKKFYLQILLLLIILPFYKTTISQSNFEAGFIILNTMDTSFVLIKNAGESGNCSKCIYKDIENGERKTYQPGEIHSYRFIDGKYYISAEIDVSGAKDYVFLEYLVDGIVDVFCYNTHVSGTKYYVRKEGEELIELVQYEKSIYKDGSEYTVVNKPYIGHLNLLFIDAPDIKEDVDQVSLARGSLINIAQEYHYEVCTDKECVVYKKKMPKVYFSLGPTVGYNTIHFVEKELLYKSRMVEPIHNAPNCYNLGLLFKVRFPYTKEKLELYYNPIIYAYEINSTYHTWDRYHFHETQTDFTISSTDLQHNLVLRYNFINRKLKPFVELGFFYSHKLKMEGETISVYYGYYEIYAKTNYFGLASGAGISYNYADKMEVFLKFSYHHGWNAFDYYQTNEFSFTLGFPFVVN